MGIVNSLQEFGISEKIFMENVQLISEKSVAHPCTGTNPREISVEGRISNIYKKLKRIKNLKV